ncbi:MAG: tetratricopeptide repeat protein [Treponema sp.]|jgi:tetratricopeptide (TPR) repeat protein|nr:tetratricopeptide repeat protein [Treponema sp.]
MPRLLRKLLSILHLLKPKISSPDKIIEEKWIADFSKPKTVRFDIKSETPYDANLRKFDSRHCFALAMKKINCIAWVDAPDFYYRDLIIEAKMLIDNRGGYSAGGILFRKLDDRTYYSFLISSKGFFRLDVVRNGMPFPLIGWTEVPDAAAAEIAGCHSVNFSIIAYGDNIIILIKDTWAAEIKDSSIQEGSVSFAAASYEDDALPEVNGSDNLNAEEAAAQGSGYGKDSVLLLAPWAEGSINPYYAEIFLEALTIDSRFSEISALFEKWKDSPLIDPQCHYHLAETFAAMNQPNAAMIQLKKSWEATGHRKTQKELLLAGRLAWSLKLYAEAETHISACFQAGVNSPEGKESLTEMAKILYTGERFLELKKFCVQAVKLKPDDPILLNFRGHALWNLKEFEKAAAVYDKAFKLDKKNGLVAKNAANVYEIMGMKKEALDRYLAACKAFLAEDNYADLGILVPKILMLGKTNSEAHGLAAKWAFGVEDWVMAEKEIKTARALEKKNHASPDPALVFLEAILLIRDGKRKQALPLLEEAVSLDKDYALFRFRLAETRFLLDSDPNDPQLNADLQAALALDPKDGWINNFAAQINLAMGNLEAASDYIKKAASALGDEPAITMNRAVLLSRQGSVDDALKLLIIDGDDQGVFANCAGNILFEAKRFEEADAQYRKALSAAPNNIEFLSNRALCLIELGLYGEADTLLTRIHSTAPSPWVLEQISYVASKKGEYLRAESACRSALEIDPNHAPSLLSLGWTLVNLRRITELDKILAVLDSMELPDNLKQSRADLAKRYDEFINITITCNTCDRKWKVPKEAVPVPGMRLMAMPPDDLPAGTCSACGKTWCIGCAKTSLDDTGRFVCKHCGLPLKLSNEGLKKLIYDWASKSGITRKKGRKKGS